MSNFMKPAPSVLERQKRRTSKIHERSNRWHDSAPRKVLKAHAAGMPDKAWKLWVHHCAARRPPRNVVRATNLLLRAATHPSESLLFGSKGLFASDRSRRKSKQATETVLAALSAWSVEAAHTHRSRDAALDLLFAAYRVPFAARKLPQHDWWELLGLLRSQCEPGELAVPLHEATQLLLGIELPLVLSALLPDIGECRHLGGPAHAALAGLLEEMATQATWLSPASLEEIPGMLSSLARCLWIAEERLQLPELLPVRRNTGAQLPQPLIEHCEARGAADGKVWHQSQLSAALSTNLAAKTFPH